MAWGKNGTPNTLTGATDDIDIVDLTACNFNMVLVHTIATGGNTRVNYTLDNNDNTDYAWRLSVNGASDGAETNRVSWDANSATSADDLFEVMYIANIASEEKLFILNHTQNNGDGAGNAPDRSQNVGKCDTTTNTGQFTRIDVHQDSTGNYAIDSNMSVLGSDITPAGAVPALTNVQDNSILVEKDTANRYWFDADPTATTTKTYDHSGDTNVSVRSVSNSTNWYEAPRQGILIEAGHAAVGTYVKKISLPLLKVGTPTGNYTFAIRDSSETIKGSATGVANDLTTSYVITEVTLNTAVLIEVGDHVTIEYDNTAPSTGKLSFPSSTSGWVANTDQQNWVSSAWQGDGDGAGAGRKWQFTFDSTPASITLPATWTKFPPFAPTRGIFAGGTSTDIIEYITIATLGNATDFGDLSANRAIPAGVSSETRGLIGGGSTSGTTNSIEYVTIATLGDATDFGDLSVARNNLAGASDITTGVFAGGDTGSDSNVIDYVTIATTGNATDFGDLTQARRGICGLGNDTRGVFGGGAMALNTIDYITIASTGNATDFGDLSAGRRSASTVASATRGCFGGGSTGSNSDVIDYITIATGSNATDFGNLTVARQQLSAVTSYTRGCFAGGSASGDTIDYITIDTLGNATDFGNLTLSRTAMSSTGVWGK